MALFEVIVNSVNDFLWTYILVVMLIGIGIYFTVRMKFMQIVLLKEIFRSIFEKEPKTKKGSHEISSMQAFLLEPLQELVLEIWQALRLPSQWAVQELFSGCGLRPF